MRSQWQETVPAPAANRTPVVQPVASSLTVDFEKAYDSVGREVLYNILIEFFTPMKYVKLIKLCLNVTCVKVCKGKDLSDGFPIQDGLKQGDVLLSSVFKFGRWMQIQIYCVRRTSTFCLFLQLSIVT
jgi:hypothetical protein